jgi:glycosyltransferase involved in cell wall biosynthesis
MTLNRVRAVAEAGLRILQAVAGGEHGGAEAFAARLAGAFERAGIAQRVLARADRSWADDMRASGVDVVTLPFGGALDMATRRGFKREIAAFRPTHVLTWMNRATRFCPRATAAAPFVHLARLGGYYSLKYYRRCDHLIGNTPDIVRYLQDGGWPAERAHYVPNFVDGEPDVPVVRAELKTPAEAPLLLGLGRLHRNKGFDVLLDAAAKVPGAYLWLAGKGEARAALERQATRLGIADRVRFLGWRRDVAALLAATDVFVCSSRIEPLGNIVIEAWAHGVPVVAAAAAGPRHLLRPGENGLLVPLEDAEALATSIQTLLDNPALGDRLAVAGRAAYEEAFTEKVVVASYLDLLRKLAPAHVTG